jgi:hypothetical protein
MFGFRFSVHTPRKLQGIEVNLQWATSASVHELGGDLSGAFAPAIRYRRDIRR